MSNVLPLRPEWTPEGNVVIYCAAASDCVWHWPVSRMDSAVQHVRVRHPETMPAGVRLNLAVSGKLG